MLGLLSRRAPLHRTNIALLVSSLAAAPWLAILLWPGQAPIWLLVVLVVVMAASGPGSAISFDVARAANPLHQIGTASGVAIVGGFLAGLVNIWVVGLVLDLLGGYSPNAFRWAMATQFVFWIIGVIGAPTAPAPRSGSWIGRARRAVLHAVGGASARAGQLAGAVAVVPLTGIGWSNA